MMQPRVMNECRDVLAALYKNVRCLKPAAPAGFDPEAPAVSFDEISS
ncbi:hypothetical protein AWB69_03701 [Caballeronia udeis]|uniref:Uncharacterized protein n=1 Tax=Caballeronia udeis TaxID=1232866 RepID=A0A158H2H0_9BURK|nr:hypothetical protein [Caballeronia udeis]SAL37950.1 hypothetical protein AWB69_03701 [Caballeronia udeis]